MAPGKRRRTTAEVENGKNGSAHSSTVTATNSTSKTDIPVTTATDASVPAVSTVVTTPAPTMSFETICAEFDTIITQLEGKYSFIRALLSEFWETLHKSPRDESALVIAGDAEWFWFAEMKYLIIFLYEMAFMEFSMSVTKPDMITLGDKLKTNKETLSNREEMQERVEFLVRYIRFEWCQIDVFLHNVCVNAMFILCANHRRQS